MQVRNTTTADVALPDLEDAVSRIIIPASGTSSIGIEQLQAFFADAEFNAAVAAGTLVLSIEAADRTFFDNRRLARTEEIRRHLRGNAITVNSNSGLMAVALSPVMEAPFFVWLTTTTPNRSARLYSKAEDGTGFVIQVVDMNGAATACDANNVVVEYLVFTQMY